MVPGFGVGGECEEEGIKAEGGEELEIGCHFENWLPDGFWLYVRLDAPF
jgi:hypothetical protein